jgi:CRP-like cAMP-binding protein
MKNTQSIAEDKVASASSNSLIEVLPPEERERFYANVDLVDLKVRTIFYDLNGTIDYIYFPVTCVGSILTVMADGSRIEASTVGNEGIIGLPVFLGQDCSPQLVVCQVPGQSLRMKVDVFKQLLKESPTMQMVLARYTQILYNLVSQSAACNRLHSIEKRCSRWLLMTHDRVGGDQFLLTHDYLASMLGVRRATVTVAAGILQKAGYIRYSRGIITILDRQGLESVTCECFHTIREDFNRLLGPARQ